MGSTAEDMEDCGAEMEDGAKWKPRAEGLKVVKDGA